MHSSRQRSGKPTKHNGNIFKSSPTVKDAVYSGAGGRGSAIWELTARFCSALDDGCPIKAVADCNINEFACDIKNRGCSSYTACSEWDANGHPTTCYSDFHVCGQAPVGTAYSHVITTYLRPPTTNCGNGICEEGEAETCAADCANHWAQRFGSGCHEDAGDLSQDQTSGALNLTGRFIGDIKFGDTTLSSSGSDDSDLFVASLDAGGRANWARAIDASGEQAMARSLTNDSNGNVIVAGHYASTINLGSCTLSASGFSFVIAKYAQNDGAHIWSRHFETSRSLFPSNLTVLPTIRVVADSNGGVVIATDFTGPINLGLSGNNNPTSSSQRDILVARFDSNGVLDWYRHLPGEGNQALLSLALDSNDNIVIGGTLQGTLVVGGTTLVGSGSFDDAFVAGLSPIGAPKWAVPFTGTEGAKTVLDIAIGESDSVVIVGQYRGDMRIGATAVAASTLGMETGLASNDAFVAKLTSTGALEWARTFGGGRTDVASKVVWDGVGSYKHKGGCRSRRRARASDLGCRSKYSLRRQVFLWVSLGRHWSNCSNSGCSRVSPLAQEPTARGACRLGVARFWSCVATPPTTIWLSVKFASPLWDRSPLPALYASEKISPRTWSKTSTGQARVQSFMY